MSAAGRLRDTAAEALRGVVHDGMTVAVGGFGLCGVPFALVEALRDTGVRGLTVVSNNMGTDGQGLGLLLENDQVAKVVASYVGENRLFARRYLDGDLEVELVPQGTLAERLRAGGAGIPAFCTPTGVGTPVADGKPTIDVDGRTFLLERAIRADLSLVHAATGDAAGNLRYRLTARNFNPLVATASFVTVAEVEHLLDPDVDGYLDPDDVMTPGIHVKRLVTTDLPRPIEKLTLRERPSLVPPRNGDS
ncbi:3-oxoacid CoA-transferase subunit A [Sediminihabitans luteus]|uniref:3-oxoacid CoA-transferase subunit A n=1 Tax=Sediminihabitans luteus TaxID=1138585 RepID=A0A2M9CCU4_9CELL|nr:CoA transferase subunit A [Sediminihabitans luteus]PJJ69184.1 3-oxoacid CoA-transferase subunit A [Sediminihabitans luteus]GII98859.1 succinyl-CoA--3-ketoacid-CoA transferase [Sediminihabitans luteus]